jgi:hypothetical protein
MISFAQVSEIEQLIAQGDHMQSLDWLEKALSGTTRDKYQQDIVVLRSRYNVYKRAHYTVNQITFPEFSIGVNQISMAILTLLNEIKRAHEVEKYEKNKFEYAIGIDLGDGESSISFINIETKYDQIPELFTDINGRKSIVTAFAQAGKFSKPYIGEEAIIRTKDINNLVLNFKFPPSNTLGFRHTFINAPPFIELMFNEFLSKHPYINAKNSYVFIGSPASWKKEDRDMYASIFSRIDNFPPYEIVSESKSALLFAKEYSKLSDKELEGKILIIDIGSSTTDFTFLNQLSVIDIPNLGINVGGRLIDEAIGDKIISELNYNPEGLDFNNSNQREYLNFLARRTKERVYGSEIDLFEPDDLTLKAVFRTTISKLNQISRKDLDELKVNDSEMTWYQLFKKLLEQVKDGIKEEPDIILITGGGSKIYYVNEICSQVFSTKKFPVDKEPFFSVCRGLSSYGRLQFKIKEYYDDIDNICNSEDITRIIEKDIDLLEKHLSEFYNYALFDKVLSPLLLDIKGRNFDIQNMEGLSGLVFDKLIDVLYSNTSKKYLNNINTAYFSPIEIAINKEIIDLSTKYGFGAAKLDISFRLTREIVESDVEERKVLNGIFTEIIKLMDKYIPMGLRNFIPNKPVEFAVWLVKFGFNFMNQIVGFLINDTSLFKINNGNRDALITLVRNEIKFQLRNQSFAIEKFVR